MDRHVHLGGPTLIGVRAQPVPDHALEPADGGLGPGARIVASTRPQRAPLTIARIENRITPACPYIFPSARRRSGMALRQVRRSVVIRNLRVGLPAMDSDRLPLRKRKDVSHGAVRAVPLRQSVEQPWPCARLYLTST